MHTFCCCSDYPYIPNSRKGTRAARDENGRSITVPDDMTYQEWYEKYVDKSGESGIIDVEIDGFGAMHIPIVHEIHFLIEGTASEKLLDINNYERR